MLRKIKVYGRLRKFLGQAEFEADARNVNPTIFKDKHYYEDFEFT